MERSTSQQVRNGAGTWIIAAAGISGMLVFSNRLTPWEKLGLATVGLLFLFKLCILIKRPTAGPGLAWYLTIWPGMDPAPFAERAEPRDEAGPRFIRGLVAFVGGMATLLAITISVPFIPEPWLGWLGFGALLVTIHAGLSSILNGLMWLMGYRTSALFENPLASRSLRDFWTKRWNLAFVEMDRILFMPWLIRVLGLRWAVFGAFMVSGLLHEMAISYPSGAGWGLPMLYFVIQGFLVLLESRLKLQSRVLTWVGILAPFPLLFHGPFRSTFIVTLFEDLHRLVTSMPLEWYVDKGLWILGGLQLLVLIASFQVPGRLNWREDLKSLTSFNRKLMWTQGVFIVATIVAFAVLTLTLHNEMMRGDRAALAVAGFAATFWGMRILVDLVVYRHSDWPKGPQFVIGHALLNCLFGLLVAGYGGLLVWHRWVL
jgi:hypothetical protein